MFYTIFRNSTISICLILFEHYVNLLLLVLNEVAIGMNLIDVQEHLKQFQNTYNTQQFKQCFDNSSTGKIHPKQTSICKTITFPLLQPMYTHYRIARCTLLPILTITQPAFSREPSYSFRSITLVNFACLDLQTNKFYLNFEKLEDYKEDKLNFVSVIGCELNLRENQLIAISQEPLVIVNGVHYFLLTAQSCSPEVLKIIYSLSEFMYVNEKCISELQMNLTKVIDISETWQLRNFLHIVTKGLLEQSHSKTAADTKEFSEINEYSSYGKGKQRSRMMPVIPANIEKYFTETSLVNHHIISQYDPSLMKDHLQKKFDIQSSRWYLYEAILQSCARLLTGNKIFSIKQFQKINTNLILEQMEKKTMNNFHSFSFEIIRNYNNRKKEHYSDGNQKQAEKQRQKQKQKLRKFKKTILQPFIEADESWIGKNDMYQEKYPQVKQKIDEQFQKISKASETKDQIYAFSVIDQLLQTQNGLDIFGSKLEGLTFSFSSFNKKIKSDLERIIKSNLANKTWFSKDKPFNRKSELLSNLEARIEICERKKQGLNEAIEICLKEKQYLEGLKNSIKRQKKSLEVKK